MAYITGRAQHPALKALKVLVIIVVIAGVAGGYLYLHPELWREWVKGTPLEPLPVVTNVYKWQDTNGQWQITDRPPPTGTKYEILKYSSDANIVPSIPVEQEEK